MKPYNVYFYDFIFKLVYFKISFLILFIIFFNNINFFFLFEVLPFVKMGYSKRFIITHITHIFSAVWSLSFFYSFVFSFPLVYYQILLFFKSGWYYYQKFLYKFFMSWFYYWFIVFILFFHLNVVSFILNFFLYWELADRYYLLRIESEISFFHYIFWIIFFKSSFSIVLSYLFLFVIQVFMFLQVLKLYKLINKYMNLLIFILTSFLYLLLPPDLLLQIFLMLLIYSIISIFFFAICIILYNRFQEYKCQR